MSILMGTKYEFFIPIPQADQIANATILFPVPDDLSFDQLFTVVQTVPTTGGTIQVRNWTVSPLAAGNIAGAVVTIANAAAVGTSASTPNSIRDPINGVANRQFTKGSVLALVLAGFATAGATNCTLVMNTTLASG